MQKLIIFKISETSGFQTFISGSFISSRKCRILMVDPALNSLDSELFNALFDVFTAFFPDDLSRKKFGDSLSYLRMFQKCGVAQDNFLPSNPQIKCLMLLANNKVQRRIETSANFIEKCFLRHKS